MDGRIEQLERAVRRQRIALTALVVVVGVMVGAGAMRQGAGVVTAERFVLTDARGKVRGNWSVGPEGDAEFVMIGSGEPDPIPLRLGVEASGHSTVKVAGPGKDNSASMVVDGKGPSIVLMDRLGYVGLGRRQDVSFGLVVRDKDFNVLFRMPAHK